MKLFFFDLETTGTNPARHGIHQISGEIVVDGETKESFDYHVRPNPKAQIDPAALQVAGVTEAQIMAYPPMEDVYKQLVEMLAKYVDRYDRQDKFFLVGYNNASFDNSFLRGFFRQNGDEYFGSWFWANSIDVMVLATQYLLTERPWPATGASAAMPTPCTAPTTTLPSHAPSMKRSWANNPFRFSTHNSQISIPQSVWKELSVQSSLASSPASLPAS